MSPGRQEGKRQDTAGVGQPLPGNQTYLGLGPGQLLQLRAVRGPAGHEASIPGWYSPGRAVESNLRVRYSR